MKYTLLIFGLLWALGASGQIYINSFTFGAAPAANLLLDDYPNAAAAYSLRKLRTAYTGNCVQVRRVSDGTLSDIGFSGNYLDTAALKTFCASTNCFVRTWYDQSTNANNAVQTTNANQAQIATSGALIYHAGEPCIDYDNTDLHTLSTITIGTGITVAKVDVINVVNYVFWGNGGTNYGGTASPGISMFDGTNSITSTIEDLNEHLSFSTYDGANSLLAVDGTFTNTGTVLSRSITTIGARPTSTDFTFNGRIKEVIFYTTNQNANRTGIQSNINSFYQTY